LLQVVLAWLHVGLGLGLRVQSSPLKSWHISGGACPSGRGESCDAVCEQAGRECDALRIDQTRTESKLFAAVRKAGSECSTFYQENWAGVWDGPHMYGSVCATGPNFIPSCNATTACGWRRICPCNKKIVWRLSSGACSGGRGESCETVCQKASLTCDVDHVGKTRTRSDVYAAVADAGSQCSGFYQENWAGVWDGPHMNGAGVCATGPNFIPSCDATTNCGWRRICPCKA